MKYTRYYVSRKNPLTWLAFLMCIGSAVLQILAVCLGQEVSTWNIWFQKVLPIWTALGFAFILAVRGPKEYYRSTTPVFWACVYYGQIAIDWHLRLKNNPGLIYRLGGAYSLFVYLRYVIACCVVYLAFYVIYRMFMTGKFKQIPVLILMTAAPFGILLYDFIAEASGAPVGELLNKLANVLLAGALFVATLAVRIFRDGRYHMTWGDRKDGRRLRTIGGMNAVGVYIMPNRNGASNNIASKIEITNMERYIHEKRANGMENFGITHVILSAYVRCVAKYPGCNRFISGQRIYQRDDDIQFTMTMKKEMRTDGDETMIKLHLKPTDSTEEVYKKFNDAYEEVKNSPLDSSFDQVAGALASLPGLVLKFTVWLLKTMDYFGKLPRFLLEVSPFHASVIFTSMGSLGIPPINHHLYDFGNLPVFIAFGKKYRQQELDAEGNVVTRRYIDYVTNTDERIVDGFYYATAMKYFMKLVKNPKLLDQPVEEVVRDID